MGPDSLVGIATGCGLNGPEIEYGVGDRTRPGRPWGPSCLLHRGTGSFSGIKRTGRDCDHPPPCNVEIKERVELYLYSPLGPLQDEILPSLVTNKYSN